jgi:succinoglycan biosynthesis transport protein ExoP
MASLEVRRLSTLAETAQPVPGSASGIRAVEPAVPPGLSAPPTLEGLWYAIRRRWVVALTLGLLVGCLGGGLTWILVPAQYNAQTLLQLSPRAGRGGLLDSDDLLTYQRTQAAMVKGYPVIRAILEKPTIADLAIVREQGDATEWLSKAILTDTLLGPEILRVSLSADNAEEVAALLNEIIRVYLKECVEIDEAKIRTRIRQLEDNYHQCSERLRDRRQTLQAREQELDVEDSETVKIRQAGLMQQINNHTTDRARLDLERTRLESELNGLKEEVAHPEKLTVSEFDIDEELKHDVVLGAHLVQLTQMDAKIQSIRRLTNPSATNGTLAGYERDHSRLMQTIRERRRMVEPEIIAKLRSKRLAAARDSISKLERDLAVNDKQRSKAEGEIKRLEAQLSAQRTGSRPLDKASASVEGLRDEVKQMEMVMKRVAEELGNLQAALPVTPRVTQMEAAKVPTAKKRDRQYKFAGATGVGLFGLVFLGVGLLEFRNRRIYSAMEVAHGLGMNLIGTVPALGVHHRTLLPATSEEVVTEMTPLTEAVDAIRARLLHTARYDKLQVVMVASAVSGEGKTSLSSHLAASLARSGRKTLLLDGDLRNPGAHNQLNMSLAPGLSDALRGEAAVETVVRPTAVDKLSLLSAGQCDRHALRVLSQGGMGPIIERLKSDYEFIVIDVCPVLPVADALLIGQHTDAAILSVLRGVSRLPAVHEAQQRLASLDIPLLGVVVLGEAVNTYGVERYLTHLPKEGPTRG